MSTCQLQYRVGAGESDTWRGRGPEPADLAATDTPGHRWGAFFADWRIERALERLPPSEVASGGGRTCAVFTIVQNESFYFPIWLNYYSRFFESEDIYVLDHDTVDGSTDGDGFQRERVSKRTFDNRWLRQIVQRKQRQLLESYDNVVFVDVDEIVAPNPLLGDLGDYLARFNGVWINCLGYEVIQMPDEAPLDLSRSILSQRRCWFPNSIYDKSVLSSVPIEWKLGFHGRRDNHGRFDPDLRLIHLHRADFHVCLERHQAWRRRRWNAWNLVRRWGTHNRITDEREFRSWYYEDTAAPLLDLQLEEIPELWKTVI